MIGYEQSPRYGELILRAIGGEGDIVPHGIILESDRPEWAVLKNEVPWLCTQQSGILAANFSIVGIQSVATRIAVIQQIGIINRTAGSLEYKFGIVQPLTIDGSALVSPRDFRRLTPSTQRVFRQQAGDPLPQITPFGVPANSMVQINVNFMISSTSVLVVTGGVVNQAVQAFFSGYERFLRPEERVLD